MLFLCTCRTTGCPDSTAIILVGVFASTFIYFTLLGSPKFAYSIFLVSFFDWFDYVGLLIPLKRSILVDLYFYTYFLLVCPFN